MPRGKSSGCWRHAPDGCWGTVFLSLYHFLAKRRVLLCNTLWPRCNSAGSKQQGWQWKSALKLWPQTHLSYVKVSYPVYSNGNSIHSCTEHSLASSASSFYSSVYKPAQRLPHTRSLSWLSPSTLPKAHTSCYCTVCLHNPQIYPNRIYRM